MAARERCYVCWLTSLLGGAGAVRREPADVPTGGASPPPGGAPTHRTRGGRGGPLPHCPKQAGRATMAFPSPSPLTPVPGPALVCNGKAELDPEGGDSPLLLGSDSSVEVAKLRLKGTLSSKFLEKLLSKVQGRGRSRRGRRSGGGEHALKFSEKHVLKWAAAARSRPQGPGRGQLLVTYLFSLSCLKPVSATNSALGSPCPVMAIASGIKGSLPGTEGWGKSSDSPAGL